MTYARKIFRGTVFLMGSGILASFLSYLVRLVLARNLTTTEFGLIYAVMGLFGLFSVFQGLGLNSAITKHVAEFKIKKQWTNIKNTIYTGVGIQVFSAFFIALVFFFLANILATYYFKDPTAALLVQVYAISIALSPLTSNLRSIFLGFQKITYVALFDVMKAAILLGITVLLLYMGKGTLAPMLAYVYTFAITAILFFLLFRKKVFPIFNKLKAKYNKKLTKKLIRFGIPVMLTSVAGIIFAYTDTVILTLFRSLEEVGLYNAGLPTARIMWIFGSALALVLFPISTELWVKKKIHVLREGISKLYKISFVVVFPTSLILFIFPELVLNALFGAEYIPAANVLRILSVGAIIFTLTKINNSILTGIGSPEKVTRAVIISALFNLAGNLLLIPSMGITGAAYSTVAAFLITVLQTTSILKKKIHFEIKWIQLSKIIFSGLLFAAAIYAIKEIIIMNVWAEAIISILGSSIIYFVSLMVLKVFTKAELVRMVKSIK